MPKCTLCPWKFLGWSHPAVGPSRNPPEQPPSFETLQGMKEICTYVRRSEATVLDWIRTRGFPATLTDGEWTADRNQIVDWLSKEIWQCD